MRIVTGDAGQRVVGATEQFVVLSVVADEAVGRLDPVGGTPREWHSPHRPASRSSAMSLAESRQRVRTARAVVALDQRPVLQPGTGQPRQTALVPVPGDAGGVATGTGEGNVCRVRLERPENECARFHCAAAPVRRYPGHGRRTRRRPMAADHIEDIVPAAAGRRGGHGRVREQGRALVDHPAQREGMPAVGEQRILGLVAGTEACGPTQACSSVTSPGRRTGSTTSSHPTTSAGFRAPRPSRART